jgi:hypothetical protein
MSQRGRLPAKSRTDRDSSLKDGDAKLRELRRRQKLAIQNMDFDRAEELEKQIQEKKSNDTEIIVRETSQNLRQEADKIIQDIKLQLDVVQEERVVKEREVRIRMNTQFESTQSNHLTALVSMERDYAASRLRETQRVIPEQEALMLQAKNAGLGHEFEKARSFRDAAQLVGETDLQARLARMDEEFEKNRQIVLKKQREEVQALSLRLEEELRSVTELTEQKIARKLDARSARLIGLLDKTVRDLATVFPDSSLEAHAARLEKELAESLVACDCAMPMGMACSARTRPLRQNGRSK